MHFLKLPSAIALAELGPHEVASRVILGDERVGRAWKSRDDSAPKIDWHRSKASDVGIVECIDSDVCDVATTRVATGDSIVEIYLFGPGDGLCKKLWAAKW